MLEITFVPSIRRGNGTGHLVRSLRTSSQLSSIAGVVARVYLPTAPDSIDTDAVTSMFPDVEIVDDVPDSTSIVVFDQRSTDRSLAERVGRGAFIIALDESGPLRETAELVVDVLHRPSDAANLRCSPDSPRHRRAGVPDTVERILVSFGGEDPAGLTDLAIRSIRGASPGRKPSVDVVVGASFVRTPDAAGVNLRRPSPDLRESFADYDLVITSYGLTAYEARAAGAAVAVVDPSRYHATLSKSAGFYRLGAKRVSSRALSKVLGERKRATACVDEASSDRAIAAVFPGRRFDDRNRCPVCGGEGNTAIGRFPDATFFRCTCSDLVYRVGTEADTQTYERRYFFEEYERQYGRTYLEDFDAIRLMGLERLHCIERAVGKAGASLLDIGCAYGPFLAAASERGLSGYGVDISADAVEYVSGELGIPAVESDIRSFDPYEAFSVRSFDVITLWYVIEHFRDLGALLERIGGMLEPGGVLAFSTPNLTGISGRARRRRFLASSPPDHFTILSPSSARRVLERYGFEVVETRVTGHHPERFPGIGKMTSLRGPIRALSRRFALGDTFETYARYVGRNG